MPGLVTIMADWNLIETEERRALSGADGGWAEKFPGVPVDAIAAGTAWRTACSRRAPGRS